MGKTASRIPRYIKEDLGDGMKYTLLENVLYYSKRYNNLVALNIGYRSDGATGALDIESLAWWIHDKLCVDGCWLDGTKITNWQCSTVLSDILKEEGRWARSRYWFLLTFALGGGECRKNGLF